MGIILTLLLTLEIALTYEICIVFAQNNVIVNGDFETGNKSGWITHGGGTVDVQSSIVQSGFYALKVDTLNASSGDYVYQNVSLPHASFEIDFWIYRESGEGHTVELVSDWYGGDAYFVTSVRFWNDTVDFGIWTWSRENWEGISIPYTLTSSTWHYVEVKANATSIKQFLFIDHDFVAEQTSNWTYLPEQIIIGDVPATPNQGFFYYDNIRLTLTDSAVGGISIPVDKLTLLAPYIASATIIVAFTAGALYVRRRWLARA